MVNLMIEISGKEFRLKFGNYCSGLEVVQVHGRGGEILGTYYPAGTEWKVEDGEKFDELPDATKRMMLEKSTVGVDPECPTNSFEELKKKYDNCEVSSMFSDEPKDTCMLCKKEVLKSRGGRHRGWYEGEEYEGFFCFGCAKGRGIRVEPEK